MKQSRCAFMIVTLKCK